MNHPISVRDRLPEPLVTVWLYGRHQEGVLKGRAFCCRGFFFRDGRCAEVHGLDAGALPALDHITHWAPLPDGPEGR